jgi:fructokinase
MTREDSGGAAPVSVLVAGESIVDIVVTESDRVEHPGGSPLNVAVGLARLGVDVDFATYLADDDHSAVLREHLESSGVRSVWSASRASAPTPTAEATIGLDGSADYVFDLHWEMPKLETETLTHGVLHVGSISALLAPGAADVMALIAAVRDRMLVTFDPNIRAQIIGARDEVIDDIEALFRLSHLAKCSAEDLQWLYPNLSLTGAAVAVQALGPAVVIVTNGGGPTIVATSACTTAIAARSVEVVDTIGAGDSFMSGLIASLIDQGVISRFASSPASALGSINIAAMVAMATACASITVTRAGANPPRRDELLSAAQS